MLLLHRFLEPSKEPIPRAGTAQTSQKPITACFDSSIQTPRGPLPAVATLSPVFLGPCGRPAGSHANFFAKKKRVVPTFLLFLPVVSLFFHSFALHPARPVAEKSLVPAPQALPGPHSARTGSADSWPTRGPTHRRYFRRYSPCSWLRFRRILPPRVRPFWICEFLPGAAAAAKTVLLLFRVLLARLTFCPVVRRPPLRVLVCAITRTHTFAVCTNDRGLFFPAPLLCLCR